MQTLLHLCVRLNPCSNGIQKYIKGRNGNLEEDDVLILVLMEYKNTASYRAV